MGVASFVLAMYISRRRALDMRVRLSPPNANPGEQLSIGEQSSGEG